MARRIVANTAATKKATVEEILKMVNEDAALKKLLEKKGISTANLTPAKGKTNPELIEEEFKGKGFFTREDVMKVLGYEAWEADKESEEYRTASKNIASPICALRKKLGSKWLDFDDRFAILTIEQEFAVKSLVLAIGEYGVEPVVEAEAVTDAPEDVTEA